MNKNEIFNENAENLGADNVGPVGKNGTKGDVGICFDRTKKKYKAYVDVFGIRINLGSAFPTYQDALNARRNYCSKINDRSIPYRGAEQYPLPKFLQLYFGLSSAESVRVPLVCIKPYLDLPPKQRKVFPNFVVDCVKKGTVPDCDSAPAAADRSSCLTPAVTAIVFGLCSFNTTRIMFNVRYEDIIQQMQDIVDSGCC